MVKYIKTNVFFFLLCYLWKQTGHIRTSTGSFFIEPSGEWKGPHSQLLHVIYQIPPISFVNHQDSDSHDHHSSTTALNFNVGQEVFARHQQDYLKANISKYNVCNVRRLT